MFKRTKIYTGVMLAVSGAAMLATAPAFAQTQTVEVTGSRIKRAEVEGALPVTTITRAEIQASGATTVAEFVRTLTFASAGNFRPQSGSSAQSFAGADLRGLGSARTLVLLDGRRLPKAPNVGDAVDINSVPMAAVERIEILQDGASAVYGSDAIAGVINFITRKDFEGIEASVGFTNPSNAGGDKREVSAVMGMAGDKGRLLAGIGYTKRGMVFTSQRPWGTTLGVSSFGNNYRNATTGKAPTALIAVPGACTETNFWLTTSGTCSYDFNAVAADEAEVTNSAIFARGETRINKDWSAYLNTSVSRVQSFGRYAPTPAQFTVDAKSPNNPLFRADPNNTDNIILRHRTAAAGNRDSNTEGNLYDAAIGVQGRIANMIDIDAGVRRTDSQYNELGRNYIVRPIAEQYINSGEYDIYNPSKNPAEILNAIKATIGRDGFYKVNEVYANGSMPIAKLGGGTAMVSFGAENREEKYADKYDSLSEGGVIEGSAGNSAAGTRKINSLFGEAVFPLAKGLEVSTAARYEKYSDYGSDFSPAARVKFSPMTGLALRASAGKGFRAPSMPQLYKQTSFSAESVFDPQTCIAFGGLPANCNKNQLVQVDTYFQANGALKSEKSTQFGFGAIWDALPFLSVKADYYNIKIKDKITEFDGPTIVDRANGRDPLPIPAGLGIIRDTSGAITRVNAGYGNEGTLETSGVDIDIQGKFKLAAMGQLRTDLRLSRVLTYKEAGVSTNGDQGLPKMRAVLSNTWAMGPFDANLTFNYIGQNGTADEDTLTKAYTTTDIQVGWNTPIKGSKLVVGALNVGAKMPELVPYLGRNFNFYLYDSYGRQTYIRFNQKF